MQLTTLRFGKVKLSVREQIFVLIGLVALYISGGYYFLLLPTQSSISEKRSILEEKTAQIAELKPMIEVDGLLQKAILANATKLDELNYEIPSKLNVESIMDLLNGDLAGSQGIVAKTGVTLVSIQIKNTDQSNEGFASFDIRLQGTMEQLMQFMNELKTAKRFNTIEAVNFLGGGGSYSANLSVNFYFKS